MSTKKKARVIVIGGGAAGFFAAITAAETHPEAEILLVEKMDKYLSKVKISGGGRCNVTNSCEDIQDFAAHYPRGESFLKKAFHKFDNRDTISWYAERGVRLKAESDGRMFPDTDDSQTIIDCLMYQIAALGIILRPRHAVEKIIKNETDFTIHFTGETQLQADRIIVTVGGFNTISSYRYISHLGHNISLPVPSLFTFNVPKSRYEGLLGISVPNASIRIEGTKLKETGPLLITHWGFSGPAVLRLSAWGARLLQEMDYQYRIHINWLPAHTEESLRADMQSMRSSHPKKGIYNNPMYLLPRRLWERIVSLCIEELPEETAWGGISNKEINKIIEECIRAVFEVRGKTTFKEEFVTCGGISLAEIDVQTMQSRRCSGLYFAGEVMDIDGITGGFNFQAAWTTAYIAGSSLGL